jgi:hypothetical protein
VLEPLLTVTGIDFLSIPEDRGGSALYGPVDLPDDQAKRTTGPTGRHRGRQPMPAPVALGPTIAGLIGAFGFGAALLPASLTASGTPAELPAAAVAALAPGAGGGAPGDGAARSAGPSAFLAPSASPSPARTAHPRARPTTGKPKPKATTPKVAPGLAGQETEVIRLVNVDGTLVWASYSDFPRQIARKNVQMVRESVV